MVCSIVLADHAPTQTPETQGLDTFTNVVVAGISTESEEIVWQESSRALNDPPLSMPDTVHITGAFITWTHFPGFLAARPGETQYTVSYSEETLAEQGFTNYLKQNSLDTRNQPANQDNLETDKVVAFEGSITGRMTSSESILVDGAGQVDISEDKFLCPFASGDQHLIAPYCNIVQMGSSVNIQDGLLHTSSGERSITSTADVPVEAEYHIQLSGIGQSAATGSANAYMQSHFQEGRMILTDHEDLGPGFYLEIYRLGQAVDIIYNEETRATGEISYFKKDMQYESGIRRTS